MENRPNERAVETKMGRSEGRPCVLVPGACLGGWAWREVARDLRAHGHDVYPVTLTGLGERVHLANAAVDLETHIEDVLNLIDYEGLEATVLVGHSYAGTVITAVADRRQNQLNAVVYLDTSPLPDGTAITDVQPLEQRERQARVVREQGDGWRWPVPDRDTLISGAFGSSVGLDDQHLHLIEQRATPHPYATMTSPIHLSGEKPRGVRRAAIFCTAGGIDVARVRTLIAQKDPRATPFADADWELHELPTGHWAMFSLPTQLAALLHRIATA
jgi:pimeloyl-ACP methyl ester carboxylesterase